MFPLDHIRSSNRGCMQSGNSCKRGISREGRGLPLVGSAPKPPRVFRLIWRGGLRLSARCCGLVGAHQPPERARPRWPGFKETHRIPPPHIHEVLPLPEPRFTNCISHTRERRGNTLRERHRIPARANSLRALSEISSPVINPSARKSSLL